MQRILDDVGEGACDERAVDKQLREIVRHVDVKVDAIFQARAIRIDRRVNQLSHADGGRASRRGGREARKLRGDLPQEPHLHEDRGDTFLYNSAKRPAAIAVDPAEMLGVQLDGCQRVLDLVCHLPRHFRPCFQSVGAFELFLLPLQLTGHAIEILYKAPELVRRPRDDPGIQVAACDSSGRAAQAVHRVSNSLRQPIPDGGTREDK